MEIFALLYFGGWGLGILAVVAGLIFWFVRRQRELKRETFDQRDN